MSLKNNECSHKNEITDTVSGDYICVDCGLILDRYFISNMVKSSPLEVTTKEKEYVLEILSRLNLPSIISDKVLLQMQPNTKKSEKEICRNLYKTLTELEIPFSVRDISAVSGISCKKILALGKEANPKSCISPCNIINIEVSDILERFCMKLGLGYQHYTLIKKSINHKNSGFSPITVASAFIYLYCRKHFKSIKLKQITEVTGISCMSVHRFLKKNDLSFRS